VETRRSRTIGFIGGAIVTLIAMTLTSRARRSAGPAGNLRDPEPEASHETSSPTREVEQSFWNAHVGAILSLAGAVSAAAIVAGMSYLGIQATNWQQERSGHQQYQSDLVLRALEPDEIDEREEQLQFLLATRLLTDQKIRDGLTAYLSGPNDLPQFGRPVCHPSYEPCVPNVPDVDCAGGSGVGPLTGQVTVVGPDVYGLDTDGDGVGCEGSAAPSPPGS
jgi:hypothetical protein